MNKLVLVTFGIVVLCLGACKENNQEAGPDLATSLVGQFTATYLIVGWASQQSSSSGSYAFVQFERRNNNTLTIGVKINDGAVQVNDRFDATIRLASLDGDGLLLPGLRNRYELITTHLNNKGSGVSSLNLYNDGKIRGGIGYINSLGQTVSLAFIP